jgi:hypothetical protein
MPLNNADKNLLLGRLSVDAKPLLDELDKVAPSIDKVMKTVEKLNGNDVTSVMVSGFNKLGQAIQSTSK